jgi:ribosomal protein L29
LATLTLLALGLVLAWPRPRSRDDAQDNDERLQQQVAALRADLARLQAQLAAIAPTFAPPPLPLPLPVEDRALADLRYELANARADAALAALPAPLKEHR